MASTLLENIKATTKKQLDGYRAWNLDAILEPRADDCIYRYLPESMSRPPMSNSDFRAYFSGVIPLLQGFDFELTNEASDEASLQSVSHGFSTANSAIGPYRMECMIIMKFNETGEKITKMDEMVDSAYLVSYLQRLGEAAQAQS